MSAWWIAPIAIVLLIAMYGLAKGLGGGWKEMAKKHKKRDDDDDDDRDSGSI